MQELLDGRWTPAGVTLPEEPLIPEVIESDQDDRRELPTIGSAPHSDRAGFERQRPEPRYERCR